MTVSDDVGPIAEVTVGKWGDDFPSLRFLDGDLPGAAIGAKVEAYMEQITYGEVPHEIAFKNGLLIAAAPQLLAACEALLEDHLRALESLYGNSTETPAALKAQAAIKAAKGE